MRACVLAAALCLVAASGVAATQEITREDIAAAGITRLSDIFMLVDDWVATTTDGYTWTASPGGLSPLQSQRWTVMIDLHVFDLGTFETINLNALPISVDQVERVVIESTPVFLGGEFRGGGTIQFFTRTPHRPRGISTSAYAMGGNETGDPGPYRYTDRSGSNVDAIGPDLAMTISSVQRGWWAAFNAGVQVQYFTDPAIRRRTTDILGFDDPDRVASDGGLGDLFYDDSAAAMRQVSGSFQAMRIGDDGFTQVFLSYVSARRYMHFSNVMGREVPADQRLTHSGIQGRKRVRQWQVRYRTSLSENRLSRHPGARFDYRWQTRRSRTWLRVSPVGSRAEIGVGLDHVWADSRDPLEDGTALYVPLSGTFSWSRGNVVNYVGGMMSFTDEDKADKFIVRSMWRRDRFRGVTVDVSYSEQLRAENRDIWFWAERGYALLDSNDVDYSISGEIGTNRMITGDVEWNWRWGDRVNSSAAVMYRHFDDVTVERHDYAFDDATCSFTGPTEVITGQEGHVGGARIRLVVPVGTWTTATARYRYQRAFEGDPAFDDAWATAPEHTASLRLAAQPRPDLTGWLSLEWRSATDWPDYEGVDGSSCDVAGETVTVRSRVDDVFTVDAGLGKRLWGGRAHFDIIGRNLTDTTVRYHPAGATFDLAFFARLRVVLR